jgi:hypothetical protein
MDEVLEIEYEANGRMKTIEVLEFVGRYIVWGAFLGTIEGIVLYFLYILSFFWIFGIVYFGIAGAILGMINGSILGFASQHPSTHNRLRRRLIVLSSSVAIFFSSILLYVLPWYIISKRTRGIALCKSSCSPCYVHISICQHTRTNGICCGQSINQRAS